MELTLGDTSCHVCFEADVKTIPDFNCQTENCQFLICKDCKKRYFVEQKKTTCPGCRQESIDLSGLLTYEKVKDSSSRNLVFYNKLGKIITMLLYFVLATVLAYWIGTILLYSSLHFRSNEPAIILLRLLIGYFVIYVLSACIYLWCCLS